MRCIGRVGADRGPLRVGRVLIGHIRGKSSHLESARIKALCHLHFLFHILLSFLNQFQKSSRSCQNPHSNFPWHQSPSGRTTLRTLDLVSCSSPLRALLLVAFCSYHSLSVCRVTSLQYPLGDEVVTRPHHSENNNGTVKPQLVIVSHTSA